MLCIFETLLGRKILYTYLNSAYKVPLSSPIEVRGSKNVTFCCPVWYTILGTPLATRRTDCTLPVRHIVLLFLNFRQGSEKIRQEKSDGKYFKGLSFCVIPFAGNISGHLRAWSDGSIRRAIMRQAMDSILPKINVVNLLESTGYIQQLYVLPTLYLCVLYLSENKQRLVPLTA